MTKVVDSICSQVEVSFSPLSDSSLNRLNKWINEKEIAMLSARREVIQYPVNPDKIHPQWPEGTKLTASDNNQRDAYLRLWLEKQGYGFTRTAGYWKENDKFAKEKSFFVVNLHDDPEFFDKMFSISEFLNQDSFMYKPKDSDEALLVYTNASPGNGAPYGSTESIGRFTPKSGEDYYSMLGGKKFEFKEKHKDSFIEESLLDRTGTGYFSRKQASRYMQENNFPYISK